MAQCDKLTNIWLLLITLSYLLLKTVVSDTINCNTTSKCHGKDEYCKDSEPCSILCPINDACESTKFYCPHDGSCNALCKTAHGQSCQHTQFSVHKFQSASLVFMGDNEQWMKGHLFCDMNSECDIQCGSFNNSKADRMCADTHIDAEGAAKLQITAYGHETLRYTNIHCPSVGHCVIDLPGINTGNDKISNAEIHFDNPNYDYLRITCDDVKSCYGGDKGNAPILYCGSGNNDKCTYVTQNGKDWYCEEKHSNCNVVSNFTSTSTSTSSTSTTTTSSTSTTTTTSTTSTTTTTTTQSPNTTTTTTSTTSTTSTTPQNTTTTTTSTTPQNTTTTTTSTTTSTTSTTSTTPKNTTTTTTSTTTLKPNTTTTSTSTTSTSTTAVTNTTSTPTSSPTRSGSGKTDNTKKEDVMIIGIVVGLVVLCIIVSAFVTYKWRKNKQELHDDQPLINAD